MAIDTDELDATAAEVGFSGVVRVDVDGATTAARAYGLAHRPTATPNTIDTCFGTASATKTLTALTVLSLVADGVLERTTTARSLLGADLPLVAGDVTVEHLLAHRSGIGDYLDEDTDLDLDDVLLTVAPHRLDGIEDHLLVVDGFPTKFPAGTSFSYCNGGYVVLSLLAERAAGVAFRDLVDERVCRPAGMTSTAFLRGDELPPGVATGYLAADGFRTNVFHLPLRGAGDGGAYTTAGDVHRLWDAVLGGRIVAPEVVADMHRPHSELPDGRSYGLGFWLDPARGEVWIEGCDSGVSFRSWHVAATATTATVIGNTTDGAWPVARFLRDRLAPPS